MRGGRRGVSWGKERFVFGRGMGGKVEIKV